MLGKKERHTLADYVTGVEETSTNKIVLYSSAQTGKTTELKQGTDYTVKETGGEGSWKQYTYTIKKENFEKEVNMKKGK